MKLYLKPWRYDPEYIYVYKNNTYSSKIVSFVRDAYIYDKRFARYALEKRGSIVLSLNFNGLWIVMQPNAIVDLKKSKEVTPESLMFKADLFLSELPDLYELEELFIFPEYEL